MPSHELSLSVAAARFDQMLELVKKEFHGHGAKRMVAGWSTISLSRATPELMERLIAFLKAKGWDHCPDHIPYGKNDKYEKSGKWFFVYADPAFSEVARPRREKAVPKSEKGKKKPNLTMVLKLLKAALKNRKGAAAAAIKKAGAKLPCQIPPAWQEAMKAVDGGTLATKVKECEEFDMSKAEDFAGNNKFARKFIQMGWPDLPEAYLAVACNEFHDFFFLDTSRLDRDGDCPVLFIDHEECMVQRKWASIASLLAYVLKA